MKRTQGNVAFYDNPLVASPVPLMVVAHAEVSVVGVGRTVKNLIRGTTSAYIGYLIFA